MKNFDKFIKKFVMVDLAVVSLYALHLLTKRYFEYNNVLQNLLSSGFLVYGFVRVAIYIIHWKYIRTKDTQNEQPEDTEIN